MPNVPNTNTAGLVLLSNGNGQNGSHWGTPSSAISGGLEQMHEVSAGLNGVLAIASFANMRIAYSPPVVGLQANNADDGTITSIPMAYGAGATVASSFVGHWEGLDTSVKSFGIFYEVAVTNTAGTQLLIADTTGTIAVTGPNQSIDLDFTTTSVAGGGVGSDLSLATVGGFVGKSVVTAAGGVFVVQVTWAAHF